MLTGGVLKGAPLIFDHLLGQARQWVAVVEKKRAPGRGMLAGGPGHAAPALQSASQPGRIACPPRWLYPFPLAPRALPLTHSPPATTVLPQVPPVDSPLLQLLAFFQLRWHDVCDGGSLTRAFLAQHPDAALAPPPAAGEAVASVLLDAADAQPGDGAAEAAAEAAAPPAATPLAALLSSLLPAQPATAAPRAQPALQPSDSSGSDDIHYDGTAAAAPAAASHGTSLAASASVASSLASTGDSRARRGGVMPLPPRRPRARAPAS